MKSLNLILLTVVLFSIFLFSSCSKQEFNFNYEPPYSNARLDELFPAFIKGSPRSGIALDLPLNFQGYKAIYNNGNITMRIIRCPSEKEANLYFGATIVDEFKRKKVKQYNNIDDRWKATGTDDDGRRWIAWVNKIWILTLSGANEELFDFAIQASQFISKI